MTKEVKSRDELTSAIEQTLAEVAEILKKSEVMGKDDDADADDKPVDSDAVGGAPEGAPPAPEGAPEAAPPAPEGAPEGAPEAAPEGQPGQEGGEGDMAAHAKELSDEELDMMLDVLMAEKERRGAGAAPEGQPAPGAAPAPAAPPAPPAEDAAMKSMKSEFASLAKSLASVAEAVTSIKGEVQSLKKSAAVAPKVVTRPAATNTVQVLQKSEPTVQRLSKSETLRFLEAEQRRGNKTVNTDLIAGVNACREDRELHGLQDEINKMGVKLPTA